MASGYEKATAFATVVLAGIGIGALVLTYCSNQDNVRAFRTTERAYIEDAHPDFDLSTGVLTVHINNVGHLPANNLEVVAHEETMDVVNKTDRHPTEWHWKKHIDPHVAVGADPINLGIPCRKFDWAKIQQGKQQIVVAGTLTYEDGFTDDPKQTWPFCWISQYQGVQKIMGLAPCDPAVVIPQLEHLDGYPDPKTEQKD